MMAPARKSMASVTEHIRCAARVLVCSLTVVLAVSACRADKPPRRSSPSAIVPTATSHATAVPAETPTIPSILKQALLTTDDLPGTWSPGSFTLLGGTSVCGHTTDAFPTDLVLGELFGSFGRGKGSDGVTLADIVLLTTPGEASRSLGILASEINDCPAWTEAPENGGATWTQVPVDLGSYGDQMVAVRATSQLTAGTDVEVTVVYVRRGDLVGALFVFEAPHGSFDDNDMRAVLAALTRRIDQAAPEFAAR